MRRCRCLKAAGGRLFIHKHASKCTAYLYKDARGQLLRSVRPLDRDGCLCQDGACVWANWVDPVLDPSNGSSTVVHALRTEFYGQASPPISESQLPSHDPPRNRIAPPSAPVSYSSSTKWTVGPEMRAPERMTALCTRRP